MQVDELMYQLKKIILTNEKNKTLQLTDNFVYTKQNTVPGIRLINKASLHGGVKN